MRTIINIALISITLTYSMIEGAWISTMLPLPDDLELLIDSMYDDGYSAEYLVKYDDISGDDLAQSDLLLGWERPLNRKPANNPTVEIIDPDRDGARNLPPWMNFSKAVFVPNEIDYKIRARHRFHPQCGRLGASLGKQFERFHPDDPNEINNEAFSQITSSTKATHKVSPSTSENLDFLLPIPEYGSTSKTHLKLSKKTQPTKTLSKQNMAQKTLINSNIIPQNPEIPIMTPGPEIIAVTPSHNMMAVTHAHSIFDSASSFFSWVEMFKKKFKSDRKENSSYTDNRKENSNYTENRNLDNASTLENLHTKLLKMREENEKNIQPRKSEEEKLLTQMDETSDNNIHAKKLRAMKPIINHIRMLHPGHRSSYIAHVGPLSLNKHNHRGNV